MATFQQIINCHDNKSIFIFIRQSFFTIYPKSYFDAFFEDPLNVELGRLQFVLKHIEKNLKMNFTIYEMKDAKADAMKDSFYNPYFDKTDFSLSKNTTFQIENPLESFITGAICINKSNVDFSFYNNTNKIFYCTFEDDPIFSNLFQLITETNLQTVVYDSQSVKKVLEYSGIDFLFMKGFKTATDMLIAFLNLPKYNIISYKDCFHEPNSLQTISKYGSNEKNFQNTTNFALSQTEINQTTDYFDINKNNLAETGKDTRIYIIPYKLNTFMKLDNTVLQTLNLTTQSVSIIQKIQPVTVLGKKLLIQFIKQPLIDPISINQRFLISNYLYYCKNLKIHLKKVANLTQLSEKLIKMSVDDICGLHTQLLLVFEIVDCIVNGFNNFNNQFSGFYEKHIEDLKKEIKCMVENIQKDIGIENEVSLNFNENNSNINTQINRNNKDFDFFYSRDTEIVVQDILSSLYTNFDIQEVIENTLNAIKTTILDPLMSLLPNLKSIITEIEAKIDINTSEIIFIKSNTFYSRKIEIIKEMENELTIVQEYNKKIKLEQKDNKYYFKITRNEYKSLKRHNFIEKYILKTGVLFSTRILEKLNEELVYVQNRIQSEGLDVLNSIRVFLNDFKVQMQLLAYILGLIDVLNAFGLLRDEGYTIPHFIREDGSNNSNPLNDMPKSVSKQGENATHKTLEHIDENHKQNLDESLNLFNGNLDHNSNQTLQYTTPRPVNQNKNHVTKYFKMFIKDCKHPLIPNCIPNTISQLKHNFTTITGLNMGGKTTYLKKITISAILAQIGCLSPSKLQITKIYKSIQIRLSTNDNLQRNISSYMQEMLDTAYICQTATKNSLIIIDELGRGTSSVEGLAMAKGVCEYLIELQCSTFFATHFNIQMEGIDSLRTKVDEKRDILLYKMEKGVSNGSWGVNVAKKVGFPNDVIKDIEYMLENYTDCV